MSATDDKYNYVDVVGVGFEGCLNLFHGDGIIALVRDLQLASRIRSTTPSRESLKAMDDKPDRKLGDFDVWYKPCEQCDYDTRKAGRVLKDPRCWKCGGRIYRDYSDRALKKQLTGKENS